MVNKTTASGDKADDDKKFDIATYLWKYFELHANQRINLFRFYTIFFAFYLTSSGFLLIQFSKTDTNLKAISIGAIALSIIFLAITFVFHRLDLRNRELIHFSEKALRKFEKFGKDDSTKLSKKFRIFTIENKKSTTCFPHTVCFTILFTIAYLSSIVSIISWGYYLIC